MSGRQARRGRRSRAGLLGLVAGVSLAGLVAVGCGGGSGTGERGLGVGSAIRPSSPPPWPSLRRPEVDDALHQAGVQSQMVSAGRLEPGGAVESAPVRGPLEGLATLLVVGGDWSDLTGASGGELEDLAKSLVLLAVEWESAGVTVRGIHLDLSGAAHGLDLDAAGDAVARLARELPDRLRLSLQIPSALLSGSLDLSVLARGAELLVCEVYGQAWQERDSPPSWDLDSAVERARAVDALGVPFLAAISLEGHLYDPETGATLARGLSPSALLDGPVSVEGAFAYEGFHRQLVDLTPTRDLEGFSEAGASARLEAGRTVRLARPTAPHLAELVRALEREGLEQLEGFVWRGGGGAPSAVEVPIVRLPAILAGTLGDPARLRMERDERRGSLRVLLQSEGDPTAWADRDFNYVEIDLEGGFFGDLELGDFARAELSARDGGASGTPMQRLRRADRLRLYFVSLEGGEAKESGEIEVRRGEGSWQATASASVLGPSGDLVSLLEGGDAPEDQEADVGAPSDTGG